jgi:uncharacterized protein (DUF885 family)
MKPFSFVFSLVFIFLFALTNVFAQTDAVKNLHALFDAEWQWTLENSPTFASYLGDKRYNNRWNDQSIDAIKRRNTRRVEALAKLKSINRAELSDKDKVNYDLFQKDLESAIANYETRLYLLPINQRGGVQTSDELAEFIQFQTVKDYEDWIARLDAFPVLMEQNLNLMKAGKAEKMIWSRQVLTRVPAQIDKQIVSNAEMSPFYAPFKTMSKDVSESEQTRLKGLAKAAITAKVIPSYQKLKDYFEKEYLPAAYPEAGIWQMSGGDKIYEFLARDYTTTI